MPRIESLTWRQNTREELNPPIPPQVVDTNSVFPDLGISGQKIADLEVDRLRAGTIKSKAITLEVIDGLGDVYLAAGKTDFTTTDNGFIIGIDDSDGNKAKAYFGDSTNYFYWSGTSMALTGGVIVDGSITIGKISTGTLQGLSDEDVVLRCAFDEGSGNVATDSSLTANHGTISGATYVAGVSGTALDFDGADDYVEIAHNANQLLTSGFTISAWCTVDTLGESSYGRIVDKSTNASVGSGYTLSVGGTNQFRLSVNGTNVFSGTNSFTLADGVFYHVVASVASDATVTMYVNGAVSGTPAATGALSGITTTNAIRIGNRSGATDRSFDGKIDDVRIYNYNLSATEVRKIYENRAAASRAYSGGNIAAASTITAGVGTNVAGLTGQNATGTGAGSTDTDIRIWAGDTFANRATADFNVTQGGLVTATGFSTNLFRGISTASIGGDGTDGALTITSGTTNLSLNTIYNFSSISITGTATLSTSGSDGIMILKTTGNFTHTSSGSINLAGKGGAGGNGDVGIACPGGAGLATNGTDTYIKETQNAVFYGGLGGSTVPPTASGGGGGGSSCTTAATAGGGGAFAGAAGVAPIYTSEYSVYPGAGGGGGGTNCGVGNSGGAGGAGGGAFYLECAGIFNFTSTINCSGVAGAAGVTAGSGGGGGGGGAIVILVSGAAGGGTNSGTLSVAAGAGGAAAGANSAGGAGGAGKIKFTRVY